MPLLLLCEREQRDVLALKPLDFLRGHDDGGAAVDGVHDGERLQMSQSHEPVSHAIIGLQPVFQRVAGQPAMFGPAPQDQSQGHVAALASELPLPLHFAIENQLDDVLAHAEGAVAACGMVT